MPYLVVYDKDTHRTVSFGVYETNISVPAQADPAEFPAQLSMAGQSAVRYINCCMMGKNTSSCSNSIIWQSCS